MTPTEYCVDDDLFEFETNMGTMQNCAWLGSKESRINKYCDTKAIGDPTKTKIKFMCRDTCRQFLPNRCESSSNPSTPPSEEPSMSLTLNPSTPPSEEPSMVPSSIP